MRSAFAFFRFPTTLAKHRHPRRKARHVRSMRFEALERRELLSAAPLAQVAQGLEQLSALALIAPQSLPAADVSWPSLPATAGAQTGTALGAMPLGSQPQPMALSAGQYSYVVITSSALANSFQPLVNQKIADGLTATIVTTDDIYANYTGTESHTSDPMGAAGLKADQIRQFVADAYANWGTRWLLLGGDISVVPMRTVYANANGFGIDNALPTDEYYACPSGPWNGNGNALWGETTDGAGGGDISLLPEVYVGRVPASSAAEVANFVAKDILYENNRAPNPKQALFLGEQLDSVTYGSTSGNAISSQVLPASWQSQLVTLYDTPTSTWSAATLINDLNASPAIVNSLGHSNATTDSRIGISDIANLTNSFPYFMYSQGCDAGALDQADPCIAEEQVLAPHAAVGVVMNTNLGWYASGNTTAYSNVYAFNFWNAVFNEGMLSPGQANAASKVANLVLVTSNGIDRWIDFETTLFGDPQTPLQIGRIGEIRGTVTNDANQNGTLDAGETGVAGDAVFVDLNQNGALDSSTVNLQSGNVPMSIPGKGTFTSTLTASNLPGLIDDVTVNLSLNYSYDGELTVTLISPAGTQIQLFNGIGGSGHNYTSTTLDDQAGIPITLTTAPYTGTFRPMGGLTQLNGEQPNGTWSLKVNSQYGIGTGTLNSWSLHIASAEPSAATADDGSYQISNLPDGTYQVRHVPQAGWTDTNPASSVQQVTISDGAILSNVNCLTEQVRSGQTTSATVTGNYPSGSTYGQNVTYTTTVASAGGTPTGSVQWIIDGQNAGSPVQLINGLATYSLTLRSAALHTVIANYTSDNGSWANSTSTGYTQVVSPAPLTITANNQTKAYGAALPSLTASYSGFVNGDTSASLSTQPTLSTTATAASSVSGGPYSITASGAVDPNYTISYVAGSLTVTPVALTITANNQTKAYGAALPTLTASYSGFVNGDTAASLTTPPTLSTTATAASSVSGGPYSITASGAVDSNYTISYVAGSLTVTPVALTITAGNKSKAYGAGLPTLTASFSGFVNGDTSASLTTPPTLSTTATPSSIAGNYPITASGAVDSNYTISYLAGSLTVTPVALAITANNQTKAYGAGLPTLTASYSGFVNGDTAASLTTQPTLSTTATAASSVSGGPYAITASGAVDANYTISYVAGSLTVTPVALTITASNKSKAYGAALPTLTASFSGFVNGDTSASLTTQPTLSTTATATSSVSGGPYSITASGAVDSNYTISYVAGSLTVDAGRLGDHGQ